MFHWYLCKYSLQSTYALITVCHPISASSFLMLSVRIVLPFILFNFHLLFIFFSWLFLFIFVSIYFIYCLFTRYILCVQEAYGNIVCRQCIVSISTKI